MLKMTPSTPMYIPFSLLSMAFSSESLAFSARSAWFSVRRRVDSPLPITKIAAEAKKRMAVEAKT